MSRTTFVIHLTADTSPVDPGDPVLQQEISDTIASAICDQIANGRWPNAGSITATVVDLIDPPEPTVPVEPLDQPDEPPHDGAEEPLAEGWTPEPGDVAELSVPLSISAVAPARTRVHVEATGTDIAICTMTLPGVRHGVHLDDLREVPR